MMEKFPARPFPAKKSPKTSIFSETEYAAMFGLRKQDIFNEPSGQFPAQKAGTFNKDRGQLRTLFVVTKLNILN